MAITKLSNIGMPQGGGAAHLKNCITYIMNPAKTEGMIGGNSGTTPQEVYPFTARRLRPLRWEMNCVCYLLDSAS